MAGFDYSVRPSKSIERKLMLECFLALSKEFPIKDYEYVGFGSFWFSDFLLFHKRLGIKSMVSIELPELADRALFNRPLRCVKVESGESTLVLPTLSLTSKSLLWMDYEKGLGGPWRQDADIILSQLEPGAILVMTVNAHRGQIVNKEDEDGAKITKLEALEALVPDLVPPDIKNKDLTVKNFPGITGEILMTHLRRSTRISNPKNTFEPLFNFSYADNAPMVTVGGMVVNESAKSQLENCGLHALEFLTGKHQCLINAPSLTLREKHALDRKLPKRTQLRNEEVPYLLRTGLHVDQIEGYRRYYKYYPIIAELYE